MSGASTSTVNRRGFPAAAVPACALTGLAMRGTRLEAAGPQAGQAGGGQAPGRVQRSMANTPTRSAGTVKTP
jgi:hypothetical protein